MNDSTVQGALIRIAVALEKQNEAFDKQNSFYRDSQRKTFELNKKQVDNSDLIDTMSRQIVVLQERLIKAQDDIEAQNKVIEDYKALLATHSKDLTEGIQRVEDYVAPEEKVTGGQESP